MFDDFMEQHCFSKGELPVAEPLTTPVEVTELAARYRYESEIILRDDVLAALPGIVGSMEPLVERQWTETKSPKALANSGFERFFASSFLEESRYCVVDVCPGLDFTVAGIRPMDLPGGRKISGISYGNSYFVSSEEQQNLGIHFHELVHGVQAKLLGLSNYMIAYAAELVREGYRNNFFERMAYEMHRSYLYKDEPFDVSKEVLKQLQKHSIFKVT